MRINIVVLFFLVNSIFFIEADAGKSNLVASSKSVITNAQAPFSSVSPELITSFRVDRTYAYEAAFLKHGDFQAVLFGSHSTHKDGLARYFFPQGKTTLLVAEDYPTDNFTKTKDLLAQNFNIFTRDQTFQSEITINPKQTFVGIGFHWRECFLHNLFTGAGLWMSISAPLVYVKNNLHFQEKVFNSGGGPDETANVVVAATMQQAFMQSDWKFGKIKSESMHTVQLADIELKVGYDEWMKNESSYLELYVGLIIPTSNKHKGEFLFEPIAGRDGHAGIMAGGSFSKDLLVNRVGDKYIQWDVAVHGEYLFRNKQMRSFDLIDKPWSRYLPLYVTIDQARAASLLDPTSNEAQNFNTPGINILTRQLYVTPGFSCDCNSALAYRYNKIEGEIGYNFFFKRAESVKLVHPWHLGPAIKYVTGGGSTNPIRDITGSQYLEQRVFNDSGTLLIPVAFGDYEQNVIKQEDLDFSSASTPALYSHTLYAVIGYNIDKKKYPLLVSGGLSYTFSQNNAVVNYWKMWLKSVISF